MAYGEGFITNIPLPEKDVSQVVEEVAANGIIRGSKEYNKDPYISGAQPSTSPRVFAPWTQSGKVFYKIKTEALDPRGFKESNDVGTLVVRYVVQPQGPNHSVLRIDAVFEEDFKHVIHPSDGSVEIAEWGDIEDHIAAIQAMHEQDAEAEQERQEELAKKQNAATAAEPAPTQAVESSSSNPSQPVEKSVVTAAAAAPATAPPETVRPSPGAPVVSPQPAQDLQQHVEDLRKQVERVVKAPGAALRSAPFHTASTLQSLPAGAEVLIEISTPYWYGVETHDGQHGWIMRNDLEQK